MAGGTLRGGCLCGDTRYVITGSPKVVSYCHCQTCRRSAGAPVTAWAMFDAGQVVFEKGEPRSYESSKGVTRRFCARCGTPLTYAAEFMAGVVDVTIGSLDDPAALPPQMHVNEARRLAWFHTADHLPRHPEFPEGTGP